MKETDARKLRAGDLITAVIEGETDGADNPVKPGETIVFLRVIPKVRIQKGEHKDNSRYFIFGHRYNQPYIHVWLNFSNAEKLPDEIEYLDRETNWHY